jgi:hypothetical protein
VESQVETAARSRKEIGDWFTWRVQELSDVDALAVDAPRGGIDVLRTASCGRVRTPKDRPVRQRVLPRIVRTLRRSSLTSGDRA